MTDEAPHPPLDCKRAIANLAPFRYSLYDMSPQRQLQDIPPIPAIPPWSNVKVFLWGAVWTIGNALAPSAVLVYDWLRRWDDPIDWTMLGHVMAANAALALAGYWRKHKALLSAPPDGV
jgi:hypothetical protein